MHVVADEDHRAGIGGQRLDQRLAALDVEVVRRLVEDQHVRRVDRGQQQRQPRLLTARQPRPPPSRPDRRRGRSRRAGRAGAPAPRRGAGGGGGRAASRRRAARRADAARSSRRAACAARVIRPAHRLKFARQQLGKRGLSLAVPAQQRDPVVLVDAQVQPVAAPACRHSRRSRPPCRRWAATAPRARGR